MPVPCDIFITEATFGLPVFRHPPAEAEIGKLLASLAQFPERAHLVGAYSLGKAQRVIRMLRDRATTAPSTSTARWSGSAGSTRREGVALGPLAPATVATGKKGDFAGAVVICPPSEIAERWARRFPDPVACLRLRLDAHPPAGKAGQCRAAADPLRSCRLGRADRDHHRARARARSG